ncbi:hypothetical protein TNCV_4583191 [Trichonephila clavipes]|nr:hypothetical protein TNCV_4583191 [Trichonephila clavipes]
MSPIRYSVPSRNGDTLNSRRAACPIVRLAEEEKRWESPDPSPGCSPSKLEWNRTKLYCHLHYAQGYGQRQAYIYPLTMMNFMGMNLTQSRLGGIINNNNTITNSYRAQCKGVWDTLPPSFIGEKTHYSDSGVMVRASIILRERTPLHVFDKDSLIAIRYKEEILEPLQEFIWTWVSVKRLHRPIQKDLADRENQHCE